MSSKGKRPSGSGKKNTKETAFKQTSDYLVKMVVSVYVFAMLVIYPLYMEKKYLNMGDAKYHFFFYLGWTVMALLLVLFILYLCAHVDEDIFGKYITHASSTDVAVMAFMMISFISFLFAQDKSMASVGYGGWYMGFASQLLFIFAYFFVSKFWDWNPLTIICAMFSGGIVYLIAVLQRFDIDFLGLYQNLQEDGSYLRLADEYIEKFVSTLGQTTWYSSYAVLILPFGMFWYYNDDRKVSRILSGIFVALGAASLCTVNSDSAYVAIMLIMMVFFWFAVESNQGFKRFLELSLIFLLTFRFIGILQTLFPERMITLITGEEKITNFVNKSTFMLIALLAVLALYIVYDIVLLKTTDEKTGRCTFDIKKFRFLRVVMVVAACLVIAVTVILIVMVTNRMFPASSALYNISFLDFNIDWGNCRGFNWRMAVKAFSHSSLKDFFIGVGPDCFAYSMDTYCAEEVASYYHGLQLACAHNEWLNMLVAEGVLGLFTYTAIFITEFSRLGKIAVKEPMAIPVMAAIAAYMGHNFFCYQQCICTPTIFIIIGIGEMVIRHTKAEAAKEVK